MNNTEGEDSRKCDFVEHIIFLISRIRYAQEMHGYGDEDTTWRVSIPHASNDKRNKSKTRHGNSKIEQGANEISLIVLWDRLCTV